MDDPHKAIVKAKAVLYGKRKVFAKSIRMTSVVYKAVRNSVCYIRTGRTKLQDSVQGLVIIIDDTIEGFQLEDFYNPDETNDETDN